MKPRITLVTLAVDDLARAVAFYRDGLGLATPGIVGTDVPDAAVAFFNLEGGLRLALWPRRSLAADSGLPLQPHGAGGFSLAHNVESAAEVEAVMRQAEAAGAKVVKAATATFYGGHAGYFQDLDGHLWEVAFNPGLASLGEVPKAGERRLRPVIRLARAADVAATRRCVERAFTPYIGRIGKPPAPMLLDFEQHIRDGHVWVADCDHDVVGVLVQFPTPEGFYVDTVAAAPHLQGRGVGRELLVFAEQEARRQGFDSLYLCTNSKMFENQVLYPKVGYVEYERKQMAGYDRIYYRKPLHAP